MIKDEKLNLDLYQNLNSNRAPEDFHHVAFKTINYDAFEPMVVSAKKSGIKRFIYASSSSVYGNSTDIPFKDYRVEGIEIDNLKGTELLPNKQIADSYTHLTLPTKP